MTKWIKDNWVDIKTGAWNWFKFIIGIYLFFAITKLFGIFSAFLFAFIVMMFIIKD